MLKPPDSVIAKAETIGGYLGHEHAYFNSEGQQLVEDGDARGTGDMHHGSVWLVVGNYYGSSIFHINADMVEVTRWKEE